MFCVRSWLHHFSHQCDAAEGLRSRGDIWGTWWEVQGRVHQHWTSSLSQVNHFSLSPTFRENTLLSLGFSLSSVAKKIHFIYINISIYGWFIFISLYIICLFMHILLIIMFTLAVFICLLMHILLIIMFTLDAFAILVTF